MLISQPERRLAWPFAWAINCTWARVGFSGLIAIDDGHHLPRAGMEGLADQAGHSIEGLAVDREDLIFGVHAGAARLRQRLHQVASAVGIVQRRTRPIRR